MNKLDIDEYTHGILKDARDTYGNKNQILVCMEELNELACVLAKYPRYEDESKATLELYDKTLDEVADVMIILDHVKNIFKISDEALDARISKKVSRLARWLLHSNSMQETIDDRVVSLCDGCTRFGAKDEDGQIYENYCSPCYRAQATEGIAPFHRKAEIGSEEE